MIKPFVIDFSSIVLPLRPTLNRVVQKQLFKMGWTWDKESKEVNTNLKCLNTDKLVINLAGREGLITYNDDNSLEIHHKVSRYDHYYVNADWETWTKIVNTSPITIELNSEYSATLEDGVVNVGCQKIPYSKVKELYEAICKEQGMSTKTGDKPLMLSKEEAAVAFVISGCISGDPSGQRGYADNVYKKIEKIFPDIRSISDNITYIGNIHLD
jgi:hypothetical protein